MTFVGWHPLSVEAVAVRSHVIYLTWQTFGGSMIRSVI